MVPGDYDAFCEVVVGFAELKGKALSPAAIKLYWAAMQHWDIADFREAAENLLRSCTFMPTPKDFEDLRKAGRPTAGEAWAIALDCGRHGRKTSGNELIDRAVQAIGGYRAIGMSEIDKTHFLERRFCEHFDSIQNAQEIREELPQIANGQSGQPKLSGPRSARDVLPGLGPKLNS